MGEIRYSEEQLRVINTRKKNILVSAAAGSGKTTVLVKRIIEKITDENNPVDIDRILVLTYTDAAASEMRSRIEDAIENALLEKPYDEQLNRQAVLIHNAQISTIHGFCLSLIRNNFADIGIDPSFRVAETGEIKLLEAKIVDELIDEMFEGADAEKIRLLADRFTTGNSLKALKEIIIDAYGVCRNNPFVREYIEERRDDYKCTDKDALLDSAWGRQLRSYATKLLDEARFLTQYNIDAADSMGGAFMYKDAFLSDLDLIEHIGRSQTYSEYYERLLAADFARLSAKKSPDVSQESKDKAKDIRENVKKIISDLKKNFFGMSADHVLEGMRVNAKVTDALCDVLLRYDEMLEEEKHKRKIIDFSDMEHFALKILLKKENGEYVPTRCALDYRDVYDEIMVDEYQDSNLVQEKILESISGESIGRFNRFMVGDVKQSIYSFRRACPELFMEKYETYKDAPNDIRIDLSANYRSRVEVVDSVNCVFKRVMGKDLGNISYDEDARLHAMAEYMETGQDHTTELDLIEYEEGSTGKIEQEAVFVAKRINDLVGKYTVCDKDGIRPARYSDIVVLLRSNKGWDDVFASVFARYSIPAFISSKTGYFSALEIKQLLCLLQVLDNPRNEIELYGVLTGVFGKFEKEEIALVRSLSKCELYDAVKAISDSEFKEQDKISEAIRLKSTNFVDFLDRYRKKVIYTPINELIEEIIDETGYMYHILSLPYGDQRRANVYMLIEKAKQYERGSFKGLYHFIRYINEIQSYEIDYGESALVDERADVVRIMSIHKSKGLEFPICIISGLSKRFNQMDTKARMLFERQLGVAFEYVDTLKNVKHSDMRYNTLARRIKLDDIAEELRVLYVAMTRAKEKLIMTACVSDPDALLDKYRAQYLGDILDENGLLPYHARSSFSSFLDALLSSLDERSPVRISVIGDKDTEGEAVNEGLTKERRRLKLCEDIEKITDDTLSNEALCETKNKITFKYPHKELEQLYTKTSVSELKMNAIWEKLSDNEIEDVPAQFFKEHEPEKYIPTFVSDEKKVSGTARGTAYHRVMELFDFAGSCEIKSLDPKSQLNFVTSVIEGEIESKRIDRSDAELVDKNKVLSFLLSDLGIRMCRAAKNGQLSIEQPFVLGISADRLNTRFPKEETVLIQGIIDAFFVEDGKIVLLDYKTDAVSSKQALIDRYELQLDYYREALEKITGMKVEQKLIYSFALNETIRL